MRVYLVDVSIPLNGFRLDTVRGKLDTGSKHGIGVADRQTVEVPQVVPPGRYYATTERLGAQRTIAVHRVNGARTDRTNVYLRDIPPQARFKVLERVRRRKRLRDTSQQWANIRALEEEITRIGESDSSNFHFNMGTRHVDGRYRRVVTIRDKQVAITMPHHTGGYWYLTARGETFWTTRRDDARTFNNMGDARRFLKRSWRGVEFPTATLVSLVDGTREPVNA